MPLLVNDTLVAKLRDLHRDSHHLPRKQGQLDCKRREIRDFETSIRQTKGTIEEAKNQAEAVGPRQALQQRELLKFGQQGDKLEDSVKELEGRIRSSESHIQWALHMLCKKQISSSHTGHSRPSL